MGDLSDRSLYLDEFRYAEARLKSVGFFQSDPVIHYQRIPKNPAIFFRSIDRQRNHPVLFVIAAFRNQDPAPEKNNIFNEAADLFNRFRIFLRIDDGLHLFDSIVYPF